MSKLPSPYAQDEMRKRFHQVRALRDTLRAEVQPLRDEYDATSQEIDRLRAERLGPLRAKLKEKEAPIFDLEREMGALVRALNGKTGEPQ